MKNNPYPFFKQRWHKRVISVFAISSLVLVVSGCDNTLKETKTIATVANKTSKTDENKNSPDYQDINKDSLTAADDAASTPDGIEKVTTANNQFAIDMYQKVNGQISQADDNVFFSPYSLSTAMAMLYAAAEGETKAQIQKTFYYPSMDILNPNSAALYNQFNKPNPDYKLATVNDLWMQQGLTPTKSYVDTVQRYYGGQVTNLDFEGNTDPSRLIINKKVAQHTNQLIPELLPKGSIKPITVAVLTNAVYFKGDWETPFEVQNTAEQPFFHHLGTSSNVKMMQLQSYFGYTVDEQVQVVQLPYKGDDLSMLVVLPKSKDKAAMQQLVQRLSADTIKQWSKDLVTQEVKVHLPKFKLEASYQMKNLLTDMGMPRAFQKGAGFNLFDNSPPIYVDDVYHKAVVIVDEKGTEAAAATGIVVNAESASAPPPVFKADHPFIFMIKDNKTDAILFLGQVNKP